jgi:uncharacterized membrane protein required for colicin V production
MLVFSLHYYAKIAAFLNYLGFAFPIDFLNLFGFVLTAVVIGIIFRLIKAIIDKIIKVSWHPLIERLGGLLAGVVRGSILTSTVLIMLVLIPLPYMQWSVRDRSLTGVYFLRIGPVMYEKMSAFLPTVKVGDSTIDSKDMISDLLSEKSVVQNKEKKPAAKE